MKNKIQETDFDFEYTGSKYIETEIIAKGHQLIQGEELFAKIRNTTIFGDYPGGYKFVTDIYEGGATEGANNVGSHDFGTWVIDYEKHTLLLEWKNGWFDTVTRAYNVDGNVEFYDVDTGSWRTTFKTFSKWMGV